MVWFKPANAIACSCSCSFYEKKNPTSKVQMHTEELVQVGKCDKLAIALFFWLLFLFSALLFFRENP